MTRHVIFGATAAVVLACAAADTFFIMGDWGGQSAAPYTTASEVMIAATMAQAVASTGATFTLALGDNFYEDGIPTDVTDPRFQETFENVFSGAPLKGPNYKFYVLAGNHDYHGNVSAEIAYSGVSSRWVFPQPWYTFTRTTRDGATVQFVMIDTVILAGNSDLPGGRKLTGNTLPGPEDSKLADDQWQWIQTTLAASKADYLVVAGHYPVWSVCEHGPTSLLVDQLKPLLEKYKATTYLAGHDHCAEYINEGTGVQYHGVGASHGCDDDTSHTNSVPAGSLKFLYNGNNNESGHPLRTLSDNPNLGAFASATVSKSSMIITHLDENGSVLYKAPPMSPRAFQSN